VPAQYRLMLDTFIETGMRWGELIALRPRHIDFLRRTVSVEETIVETSKVNSPTGQRFIVKPYPEEQRAAHLRRPPSLARRARQTSQQRRAWPR
jgi:integrase